MKVAELIEALKQMPQDAQVYSYLPYDGDMTQVASPDLMYTDKAEQQIDWAFFEENADDDMNIEDYVKIVVL